MPDRKSLVNTLWLTSALALLASVLAAPIRTSGFVSVSSRPDCLRRNFGLPPGRCTIRLSSAAATDAVLQVNSPPSENEEQAENEEQDREEALYEPQAVFLTLYSYCKAPDRQLITPRSILSHYPLRC